MRKTYRNMSSDVPNPSLLSLDVYHPALVIMRHQVAFLPASRALAEVRLPVHSRKVIRVDQAVPVGLHVTFRAFGVAFFLCLAFRSSSFFLMRGLTRCPRRFNFPSTADF